MIHETEIVYIHDLLIERFGGLDGIRGHKLLSSALKRPFQTLDGKELHSGIINKAAALMENIVSNHPFVDGNKRTGYMTMRLFLIKNGLDIEASQDDKFDFVIRVASGKDNLYRIVEWLNNHTKTAT